MSASNSEQPQSEPAQWLSVATRKLCDSAKARIAMEIEAHFSESVEGNMAAGCGEDEARSRALAELGDPGRAARRFLKMHLSAWEVLTLKNIVKRGWIAVAAGAIEATLAFIAILVKIAFGRPWGNTISCALVIASFAVALICFYVGRRTKKPAAIRLLLIAEMMQHPCNAFLILAFTPWPASLTAILCLIGPFFHAQLLMKLVRNEQASLEIPTRGAPAS